MGVLPVRLGAAFRWQDLMVFQIQLRPEERHLAGDARLYGEMREGAAMHMNEMGHRTAAATAEKTNPAGKSPKNRRATPEHRATRADAAFCGPGNDSRITRDEQKDRAP